jgi:hypothetical protein
MTMASRSTDERPGKGGDYGAGYEVRAINRWIMAKLGYLSVFTLSIRTPRYAGTSSGASSSSTRFIMVTDGLRSEAIFATSKLTTSPRRCSPYLPPAMCCKPIRSSP